jgi:hypothetical protein
MRVANARTILLPRALTVSTFIVVALAAGCVTDPIAPKERTTASVASPPATPPTLVAAGTQWFNETAPDGSTHSVMLYACSSGFGGTRVDTAFWLNATAQEVVAWMVPHGYADADVEVLDPPADPGAEPQPQYVAHGRCP